MTLTVIHHRWAWLTGASWNEVPHAEIRVTKHCRHGIWPQTRYEWVGPETGLILIDRYSEAAKDILAHSPWPLIKITDLFSVIPDRDDLYARADGGYALNALLWKFYIPLRNIARDIHARLVMTCIIWLGGEMHEWNGVSWRDVRWPGRGLLGQWMKAVNAWRQEKTP